MMAFFTMTWHVISDPQTFFESVREQGWWPSYRYFLVISLVLSLLSPPAWAMGVDGSSPINTSTTAQRDVYRWWHDALNPQMGRLSLPIAMLALLLDMHLVLVIFTPVLHVVFRALRGQGPVSHAWKAICYGMAPTLAFGFLPFIGLLTGVYATVLQLAVGPATLYQVKDGRAYLFMVVILSIAIIAFWQGVAP